MPDKKRNATVEIEADVYQRVKNELLWSRQSVKSLVNNTLEWLLEQDEEVQGAIVAGLPRSMRTEFTEMVLRRMNKDTIPFQHERITGEAAKELPPNFED